MEEMFTSFMGETKSFMREMRQHFTQQDERLDHMSQEICDIKVNVKAIEIQVGQIANIIGGQHKQG
ncbi:hypothetical protein ACS0TY_002822 [Phlomoides rotata]